MRIHRVVAAVGHTLPRVRRNPVVVLLGLVPRVPPQHALRQVDPRQIVPVVHHRNLDVQGAPHPHAPLHLVRVHRIPPQHDARKELVGKWLLHHLNIS